MAFNRSNLSLLSYGNGFKLWHYTTGDATGDIDTSGYFNSVAGDLSKGDIIIANTSTGGTAAHGMYAVLSITAAGVVDVGDLDSLGGTDTD